MQVGRTTWRARSGLRDSKDPSGPVLTFAPTAWQTKSRSNPGVGSCEAQAATSVADAS
ncbi:DUF397 domain-containing protein [Micromonospora sp. WMMC415]|nr:DUF397 domain-containing protein [Micromonospora sp. WMMC415]